MKNLNFLRNLFSPSAGLQSNDVSVDCRLTVGSPSGFSSKSLLKLVSVLVLVLTIGVGNAWADTVVYSTGFESTTTDTNYKGTVTCTSAQGNGATWEIYYGNFTTDAVISGSKGAQMRLYNDNKCGTMTQTSNISNVDSVTFAYKCSNTNVRFKVQYSTNSGSTWTDWQTGLGGNTTTSYFKKKLATRAATFRLKIVVTGGHPTSSNRKLTIDDIVYKTVSDCDDPATALSVSAAATTIYAGVQTQLSTSGGNGSTITYSVTSANSTYATIDGSNKFSATQAGTYTVQASQDEDGGTCGGTATVNITVRYQVKWSVNGNDSYTTGSPTTYIGTHDTKVSTLPTDPTSAMCDNTKVFVGWTTSSYSHATNAPTTLFLTAASSPNVTDNVTYYAVFANRTDFTRVTSTSQLAAGKQIVVVDDQNSKVLTTAPGYATAPTESSSKITPSNNMIWTLEANSTNWKLKTSGSYLGASSTSNGTSVSLTSTNSIWTIGASSSGTNNFYLLNTGGTNLCLEYYSSGSSWVVYANKNYTSSTYFTEKLYVATLTNYATSCCTKLGSINGSINMTSSTDGTVTVKDWSEVSNASSYTVKLYQKDGESWDLVAGDAGTKTGITSRSTGATFSGLTYGATYKFTVTAIGTGSYCDGPETAVTSINGNSLTDNKFLNKYSIYIDDATNDNYAHNYISSISSHAGSVDITLLANKDYYQYKLSLGGVVWWGNTGKMTSANCTSWTFTDGASNCKLQTNLGGTYTFALAAGTPAISVTYPPDDQASGKNIYFDNSILEWSDIFYRVGSGSTNVKEDFTLVAGTDNFYYTTTPSKSDISAWHIANNTGWTGDNDIYKTNTGDKYAITKSIAFQQYVVTGHMTIIPTTTSSKGSEDKNNNCDFYTINTPTSGMLTHTATITTPSHGTITISNTDQSLSATSTTANLPHRTILTITATPDDGYSLSSLTVNAAAFTSGSTHILAADATIAATFTANKYDVTLKPTSQTGSVTDQVVQATYGSAMPTTVKTAGTAIVIPERTGYSFTGWFDNSSGGKQYYQYTGSPKTLSSANAWDKTSATNLYAQWSINSYTLTWATVRGKVTTAGTGADVNATGNVSSSQEYNTALTAPVCGSANGYTFTGWSPTPASNMPAENTTYTAQWSANVYTVTLDNQSATTAGAASVSATFGQAMPSIASNLPAKTGYRFDGYYTAKNGGGTKYYNADGSSATNMAMYSANPKLYANWVAQLTFSVNGVVDDELTRDVTESLPSSATVPTSCGDCWAFAGWDASSTCSTTPGHAGGENAATHGITTPTTLYAVFGQTEFEWITSTSELVANDNYVLTNIASSKEYALSNTANPSYSNDAASTDVTDKVKENAEGYYIYNPAANNIWKFTGTSSSGQLYNAASDKYLNLSGSGSILSTTNNLTFTLGSNGEWKINSTKYLRHYSANDWDAAASLSEGKFSCYLYHQTSATYATIPSCETYDIVWKVDGTPLATGSQTEETNTCTGIETLPEDPDDDELDCAKKFMGWSEHKLVGPGKSAPADLFTSVGYAPAIEEDKTFHAVFATGTPIANTYVLGTIDDLKDGQTVILVNYANDVACKNTSSSTGTLDALDISSLIDDDVLTTDNTAVKWTVTKSGDYYVFKSGDNYLRSSGASSLICDGTSDKWSISAGSVSGTYYLTSYNGSNKFEYYPTNSNFTSYSGTGAYYNTVFYVPALSYSNYMTSCCDELVVLSTNSPSNGTITFDPVSPIATCDANQNVTMTITPNAGYKLSEWSVATGDGKVAASSTSPAVVTGEDNSDEQEIALVFNQHLSGTYAVSATFEQMHDEYYDYMHDNAKVGANRTGSYSAPSRTSKTAGKTANDCKGNHYKFKGWVVSTEINDDGTLKSGYTLITAGTSMTASNKIYYAVWAEEE